MFRSGVQTEPIGEDGCHKGEKDHPIVDHLWLLRLPLSANGRTLSSVGIQVFFYKAVKRRKKKQNSELKYLLIAIYKVLKIKG